MNLVQTSLYLSKKEKGEYEGLCLLLHKPVSQVGREVIVQWIASQKKLLDDEGIKWEDTLEQASKVLS